MPSLLRLHLIVITLFFVTVSWGQPAVKDIFKNKNEAIFFIENKGQITDHQHHQRNDIGFKLSGKNVTVFVGNNGQLHYQFYKNSQNKGRSAFNELKKPGQWETYRMDVSLIGANEHPGLIKSGKRDFTARYYTSSSDKDGTLAASYDKLLYKNIYPGIDWEIFISDNHLKYNFIVHENGRVEDIRLKFDGATHTGLLPGGEFTAGTPLGNIVEAKPVSYEAESRKAVSSGFDLHNNILGFKTAPHHGTLVIDPVISWATYYGGSDVEEVYKLKSSGNGHLYVTGITQSTGNIATTGSFQQVLNGSYDAFVASISGNGQMEWATYFGGSGEDYAFSLASDVLGNVLITGATSSNSGIATAASHQPVYAGDSTFVVGDAFLAKFNENGQLLWSTYFGGNQAECSNAVITDADNNIYIAGYTMSDNNMATPGSYKSSIATVPLGPPPPDAFLAKFSPAGQLIWSTYFGGTGNDFINAMDIDDLNNIYVAGETSSMNISTPGSYQTSYGGGTSDAFITRFNGNGFPDWCTYFGGSNYEHATDIVKDKSNGLYLSGSSYGSDRITTLGAHQEFSGGGGADGFLSRFDINGQIDWSTFLGGNGFDQINGLAADTLNNVFATGFTTSTNNMLQAPGSGKRQFIAGVTQPDGFINKFNQTGQRLWGSYYPGNAKSVDCAGMNSIYVASYTLIPNLATPGTHQLNNNGAGDILIAQIGDDTTVAITQPFKDTLFCSGSVFRLPYYTSNEFLPGNRFTAQLSDATGSFASPLKLGDIVSVATGSISCRIPPGTNPGNGYRIRIVASMPVDTSVDNSKSITIRQGMLMAPVVTVTTNPASPVSGQMTDFTANVSNGGSNITYQWLRNGVAIPGATSNPYTALMASGEKIAVIAYCHEPCIFPDSAVSNNISIGIISTGNALAPLKLYPNPNNGSFTVEGKLNAQHVALEVVNVTGQVVVKENAGNITGAFRYAVKTGDAAPGIYLLKVVADDAVIGAFHFTITR